LADVFEFCQNAAFHSTIELQSTVLIHVSFERNEQTLMDLYTATELSNSSGE
jgi:hypothetical protein